jgi:signal transduction histidine kinase
VLDSSEIEAQGQSIDLNALLRLLVEEHQDLAQGKLHTLVLDAPAPLPPAFGIERLVREAIANLITNAIKYTPLGGSIQVRGKCEGRLVRVEVTDNGIGIPPDQMGNLFKEFVRLKHPTDRTGKVSGSGLGLSIVRRIIELHGGSVRVESVANEGSTFIIELPVLGAQ